MLILHFVLSMPQSTGCLHEIVFLRITPDASLGRENENI